MLLEMALADFSYERDWNVTSNSPGKSPVDLASRESQDRGSSLEWRGHISPRNCGTLQVCGDIEEEQQLRVREEAPTRKATISRSPSSKEEAASRTATLTHSLLSDQFYGEEAAVSLEWEDSPGKFRMVQESRSLGRSSYAEPLPLPPALRPIAVDRPRSVCTVASPINGGVGRGVKSILGGIFPNDANKGTSLPKRATPSSGRGLEHDDRDLVDSSDDGEATSPVSTLDLPMSPLTRSYYPRQSQESATRPRHGQESARRQGPKSIPARPTSHWTDTLTSEELPAVMEEDEENLEAVYGYHTMEFQTMDCPSTSEDRRDWRMSGRKVSSKSFSAPNSRRNSSVRPTAANRGRRRSDFDWPEDFEERPEEVVKEVDESLWAFSPVRSTFVFSGNDTADGGNCGNLSQGPGVTGTCTPPGSSPGLGSVLEHVTLKKSLGRFASKTPPLKSPSEGEYPSQRSSRLKHYSVNGDDDYVSPRGHSMKRSYSCLVSCCSDPSSIFCLNDSVFRATLVWI